MTISASDVSDWVHEEMAKQGETFQSIAYGDTNEEALLSLRLSYRLVKIDEMVRLGRIEAQLTELAGQLIQEDESKNCPFCHKDEWGIFKHEDGCPFYMAYEISGMFDEICRECGIEPVVDGGELCPRCLQRAEDDLHYAEAEGVA